MGSKSGLITIFIHNFHFPVAALRFQRREYCGITRRLVTFVHLMYGVWVPNYYFIKLVIVQGDSESSVSPRWKHEIGDAHSIWASLIKSIANTLSISCFQGLVLRGRFSMVLNKSVFCRERLIQIFASLPLFHLNFRFKNVEILTALIKVWLDMRCNFRTSLPRYDNHFLPFRSVLHVVYAYPTDPPPSSWIEMYTVDIIVDISA